MSESRPNDAQITVVGGGVVGAATLYHLALAGKTGLQLLERTSIASQTSGQGAGLCGQVRSSVERTRLAMRSVDVFRNLKKVSGHDPLWHEVGSLRISLSPERDREFERMAQVAANAGLEVETLDRAEVARRFPLMKTGMIRSALWCPSDGYLNAPALTRAYISAARDMGASVREHTQVTGVERENGRVRGLTTSAGAIRTEMVINAAGVGAAALNEMAGIELPIIPVRHMYFVTEPIDGVHPELPVVRIPDLRLYLRPDESSLLLGGFEGDALALEYRSFARDGSYPPLEPEQKILKRFAHDAAPLIPSIRGAPWSRVNRGWPTFTPDGRYLIGPVTKVPGLVMAAGCNAHGVSGSAGLAQMLLESLGDDPSEYVRSLSPNRYLDEDWDSEDALTQARSVYATYYSLSAIAQGGV